jgi:hypothetical protein
MVEGAGSLPLWRGWHGRPQAAVVGHLQRVESARRLRSSQVRCARARTGGAVGWSAEIPIDTYCSSVRGYQYA